MKRWYTGVIIVTLLGLLTGCAGGGRVGVSTYHHSYGPGPWWGYNDYYIDRRPIIVDGGDDKIPVTPVEPLQPGPEAPDMGMPDIGGGDFGGGDFGGGDFGGDW